MDKNYLFITCAAELEPLLMEELKNLGYSDAEIAFRGCLLPYSLKAVYEINFLSRIAGRVLLPLATFSCRDAKDLYDKAKEIDWLKYLSKEKSFAIDVSGKHRAFTNTLYAAQVLKDALCDFCRDKTGERPSVHLKSPDLQLSLFLEHNKATIYLDTSGEPLFKRGYRKETVTAPLQESLASAFLMLAGYTGEEVLLDPCTGSGTILIEAALMASKTPPGYLRKKWGFFNLPEYSREEWAEIRAIHEAKIIPLKPHKFYGYEINKENARMAVVNIREAGFVDRIIIKRESFVGAELEVKPNLIICNPPHGLRLGSEEDLKPLYRALGDFFKNQMSVPGKAFVFTTNSLLAKEVGLKAKKRHIVKSSGDEGRLLEFEIYGGELK